MGLISYFPGATPDKFAKKNIYKINLIMSKYQQTIYEYYEEIEKALEKQKRFFQRKGKGSEVVDTFRAD